MDVLEDLEFCQICTTVSVLDNRCYNCYPPQKKTHSNYVYRKRYFHKYILQLIDKLEDLLKIEEVFEIFNENYKQKALPYKYFIAKIADLLEIKHVICIKNTKRNIGLWNDFLSMKPLEIIEKKRQFREYILNQLR